MSSQEDGLSLSEFIAQLILDTFEGIIIAQLEQEQRLKELGRAAELELEEFAKQNITSQEIDLKLIELFPHPTLEGQTSIQDGMPYRPAQPKTPEHPPILDLIGYKMKSGDYRPRALTLTKQGVDQIRQATRLRLAQSRQEVIARLIQFGPPRVLVDHGTINAKVIYRMCDIQPSPDRERSMMSTKPSSQVCVRLLDSRSPIPGRAQMQVFGELTLAVKTLF